VNWNKAEIREVNISHASSIRQLKNKLDSDEIVEFVGQIYFAKIAVVFDYKSN